MLEAIPFLFLHLHFQRVISKNIGFKHEPDASLRTGGKVEMKQYRGIFIFCSTKTYRHILALPAIIALGKNYLTAVFLVHLGAGKARQGARIVRHQLVVPEVGVAPVASGQDAAAGGGVLSLGHHAGGVSVAGGNAVLGGAATMRKSLPI